MGDGAPGTFEQALAAAFGDRVSEFSEDLTRRLRRLYERGVRDGRSDGCDAVTGAHHRAARAEEALYAMHDMVDERLHRVMDPHSERALREMVGVLMAARADAWDERNP